jgi:hypothetical protein
MGMGLRFEQDMALDDGICAIGHWDLEKFGLGKENRNPIRDPQRTIVSILTLRIFDMWLVCYVHGVEQHQKAVNRKG